MIKENRVKRVEVAKPTREIYGDFDDDGKNDFETGDSRDFIRLDSTDEHASFVKRKPPNFKQSRGLVKSDLAKRESTLIREAVRETVSFEKTLISEAKMVRG